MIRTRTGKPSPSMGYRIHTSHFAFSDADFTAEVAEKG